MTFIDETRSKMNEDFCLSKRMLRSRPCKGQEKDWKRILGGVNGEPRKGSNEKLEGVGGDLENKWLRAFRTGKDMCECFYLYSQEDFEG